MCSEQISGEYLIIDLFGGPAATSYPAKILSVAYGVWTCNDKATKLALRKIDESLYFGVFPVTQGQFIRVMGLPIGQCNNAMQPMTGVDYLEICGGCRITKSVSLENSFMGKLREGTKLDGVSLAFDLPTQEQWLRIYQPSETILEYEWKTHPLEPRDVGAWSRNDLGVYDMNGQIQEYCQGGIKCKSAYCDTDTSPSGFMGSNNIGFRVCVTVQ